MSFYFKTLKALSLVCLSFTVSTGTLVPIELKASPGDNSMYFKILCSDDESQENVLDIYSDEYGPLCYREIVRFSFMESNNIYSILSNFSSVNYDKDQMASTLIGRRSGITYDLMFSKSKASGQIIGYNVDREKVSTRILFCARQAINKPEEKNNFLQNCDLRTR